MGHFAHPLQVTPFPATRSIRISARASDTRIDEWTIPAADVLDVLGWPTDAGWRGSGQLRVLIDGTGGSVAFVAQSGDRAIIRGPESMAQSFLAHLRAAYEELPSESGETPYTYVPVPSVAAEGLAALQQQVTQGHNSILTSMQELMNAVQAIARNQSAPVPQTAPQAPIYTPPVLQGVEEASVFIPSVSTDVEGTGLTAEAKTSSADDLAAAAAALKLAKRTTSLT
jgi:hypothetical protein